MLTRYKAWTDRVFETIRLAWQRTGALQRHRSRCYPLKRPRARIRAGAAPGSRRVSGTYRRRSWPQVRNRRRIQAYRAREYFGSIGRGRWPYLWGRRGCGSIVSRTFYASLSHEEAGHRKAQIGAARSGRTFEHPNVPSCGDGYRQPAPHPRTAGCIAPARLIREQLSSVRLCAVRVKRRRPHSFAAQPAGITNGCDQITTSCEVQPHAQDPAAQTRP